jgi:2-haloacid dehalogenase
VLRQVDGAVIAGEEGTLKPAPEIIAVLIRRYRLEPAETRLIDDMAADVEGGRAVGVHAHVFTGGRRSGAPSSLTGCSGRAAR